MESGISRITSVGRSLFTVVFLLMVFGGCCLGEDSGTLHGTVIDLSGVIIPRAVVVLYWNPPGNIMSWNGVPKLTHKAPRTKGVSVTVDDKGQFSVKLFPGWWDVFVHADGLYPVCQIVKVEAGKTQTIEIHFKLTELPIIE